MKANSLRPILVTIALSMLCTRQAAFGKSGPTDRDKSPVVGERSKDRDKDDKSKDKDSKKHDRRDDDDFRPTIIRQPESQTVCAGSPVTFCVVVAGPERLSYQWVYDCTNLITGATQSCYSIPSAATSNAGSYTVILRDNHKTEKSEPAMLTVSAAPADLVAWWKAEGNADDSTGNNNASVVNGIVYTNGEVGQAFDFDGTSSFITVPASPTLAVSNLTIEAWIYPTDPNSVRPILECGGPGQVSAYSLWLNTQDGLSLNPGGLHALIRDQNFSNPILEVDTFNTPVEMNQWNHVAFTADLGTGVGIIYWNGVPVSTNTVAFPVSPASFQPVNLGYRDAASLEALAGAKFQGRLDEVSVYSRPLTASEIKSIFEAGHAGKCPLPPVTLSCAPVPPNIVAWWKAEGNADDSTGNNNASVVNGIVYTNGEVGQAFDFDGTSSFITVPASPTLAVSNLTIEAWIYPTDPTSVRPILECGGPGQVSAYSLWLNTQDGLSVNPGGLHALIRDQNFSNPALEVDTFNTPVEMNQWNHVAFTADLGTGVGIIYWNGVPVSTNTVAFPVSPASFQPVNLGYRDAASLEALAGAKFQGRLDEVSIYSRALTASEIKSIFEAGHAGKCSP